MTEKNEHFQFKMKCLGCGLHQIALSWKKNWAKNRKPFCNECGKQTLKVLNVDKVDKQIYEVVPGNFLEMAREMINYKLKEEK